MRTLTEEQERLVNFLLGLAGDSDLLETAIAQVSREEDEVSLTALIRKILVLKG